MRDLIVFGEDWGRHPSSTQHLIARLAVNRRIAWINSVGMRRPRLNRRDLNRVSEKIQYTFMQSAPNQCERIVPPDGFTLIEPKVLPLPGNPLAARINQQVGGRLIRRTVDKLDFNDPVIWISLPTAVDLLPALPEAPIAYYCGDDFGGLAGIDHGPVLACEARLSARADAIFTVSDALAEKFDSKKTVDLPHGVDFDLFATPAPRAADLPNSRCIAGFYGSISEWLDQDLVAAAAQSLPDWTFVFVGSIECNVSQLAALPNVQFLGPRPHAVLPGYVQHWTVSTLPFVDNAQIRACNPLKLREYMAAGTPIVSTAFPALKSYADHLSVVSTPHELIRALELASHTGNDTVARVSRSQRVSGESWEARAAQAEQVIESL